MTKGGSLWIVVLAVGAAPLAAAAHPTIDSGLSHLSKAEFDDALAAFASAETSNELSLSEYVQLLEGRALAYLALRDQRSMNAALLALASITPEHRFSEQVPPDIIDAFELAKRQLPGQLAVRVQAQQRGSDWWITAQVDHDVAHLSRFVRLHTRGHGYNWSVTRSSSVRTRAGSDGVVQYYAEVIGPGGAVLARQGSATHPRTVGVTLRADTPGHNEAVSSRLAQPAGDSDRKGIPWLWIGVGAAAVVAVGVVVGVLLASPSLGDDTQPGPLMVRRDGS